MAYEGNFGNGVPQPMPHDFEDLEANKRFMKEYPDATSVLQGTNNPELYKDEIAAMNPKLGFQTNPSSGNIPYDKSPYERNTTAPSGMIGGLGGMARLGKIAGMTGGPKNHMSGGRRPTMDDLGRTLKSQGLPQDYYTRDYGEDSLPLSNTQMNAANLPVGQTGPALGEPGRDALNSVLDGTLVAKKGIPGTLSSIVKKYGMSALRDSAGAGLGLKSGKKVHPSPQFDPEVMNGGMDIDSKDRMGKKKRVKSLLDFQFQKLLDDEKYGKGGVL